MQNISKYALGPILAMIVIGLVLSSIIMEFLPEDEAKVFVIPTMVAALFVGVAQIATFRNR